MHTRAKRFHRQIVSSFNCNPSGSIQKLRNAMQMCKCNPAFASKNMQRRICNAKGIKADIVYACRGEDVDDDGVPVIVMQSNTKKVREHLKT